MREIKFRCWSVLRKEMSHPFGLFDMYYDSDAGDLGTHYVRQEFKEENFLKLTIKRINFLNNEMI